MNPNEIRARLRDLQTEAEKIVETADAATGAMNAEQNARFDAIMAEMDAFKADLDRKERLVRQGVELGRGTGRLTSPAQAESEEDKRIKLTCGFADVGDFALSVHRACLPSGSMDPRLSAMPQILGAPTNFHQEGGSSDGYMVPPEFRDQIWELIFADEGLIGQTDVEPTNSNSVEFLTDETTPWGATGVTAHWRSEGSQMTPSRLLTSAEQLKLHELYAFVTASDELLEDAPRLTSRLLKKAPQAINYKIDDAIIYGSGAGKPKGYMNSGALITVAPESGQGADTLNALNIAHMYSRMLASSLPRAIWLMNSDVLPQLINLTIPNGNALMWTPPDKGITDAPGGFLLGRPIQFTEHAKTLGDKGDVQFVDLKGYYAIRKASGIQFAQSMHLFFDYGLQAFRWTVRLGGQPYLSAPVSPANGSNTKSYFVTLDDRP